MATSRFIYTCLDDVVSAGRIGFEQSLDFLVSQYDIPLPKVDKRQQLSRRGKSVATTVFGEWREGEIVCPYIEPDEVVFWIEFLMSIRNGERFEIEVRNFPGFSDIRMQNITAITTADQLELPRYQGDSCRAYTCSLPWREVN